MEKTIITTCIVLAVVAYFCAWTCRLFRIKHNWMQFCLTVFFLFLIIAAMVYATMQMAKFRATVTVGGGEMVIDHGAL